MYILKEVPAFETIKPQGFKVGSRSEFDKTYASVKSYFGKYAPTIVTEWDAWSSSTIPASDSVKEYIELYVNIIKHLNNHKLTTRMFVFFYCRHQDKFQIPLRKELFANAEFGNDSEVLPVPSHKRGSCTAGLEQEISTDSVNWSRRGYTRKRNDPHSQPFAPLNTAAAEFSLPKHNQVALKEGKDSEEFNDDDNSESESDDECHTEGEEADDNGWLLKQRNFNIPKLGNAAVFVGRTFTIGQERQNKAEQIFGIKLKAGKVIDVVCQLEDLNHLYFRGYDHVKHRRRPTNIEAYWHVDCLSLMTTNAKNK